VSLGSTLCSTICSYNIAQHITRLYITPRVEAAYCYGRSTVVCWSVCRSATILGPTKTAELTEMPFGMWTRVWVGPMNRVRWGPDPACERAILRGKRYPYGKWLAERVWSAIFLQRNSSFRETPDQVHFSCRKLCWRVTKYDTNISWLTVPVYELFNTARINEVRPDLPGQRACSTWMRYVTQCTSLTSTRLFLNGIVFNTKLIVIELSCSVLISKPHKCFISSKVRPNLNPLKRNKTPQRYRFITRTNYWLI